MGKRVQDTITGTLAENVCENIRRINAKMKFPQITEQEICRITMRLKDKRSSGFDDMSNVLLKRLINVIKGPLCTIFNKSLQLGQFPDLMKIAKVLPLFKSGYLLDVDNYRPISLLPVMAKILKKFVYQCVSTHMDENNILFNWQFGFRAKHSTVDAIADFVGNVLNAFEDKQMVLTLFVDLRKAFDSVSHQVILQKLKKLGIDGIELLWFENYLTNRRQFVSLNDDSSKYENITVGIPQGSLLGVQLFQILINDLPKCLQFCSSILYADDTTIFLVGKL